MELGTLQYFTRHGYASYADVKCNIKQQEIKDLVSASKLLQKVPSKLQIQCKKGYIFFF